MKEYKGESFAIDKQIDLLQLEMSLEKATISMHYETNGYIPKVYPYVINDLGIALADAGRMDEAQELFREMADAAYMLTDDVLYANYAGTTFVANLFIRKGMKDRAIAKWEDYRDYLMENEADYDKSELDICLKQIQKQINEIQGVVIY